MPYNLLQQLTNPLSRIFRDPIPCPAPYQFPKAGLEDLHPMGSSFVFLSVFYVLRAEQRLTPFTEKKHVLRGSSCGEACMHPHRVTPTERASTKLCQVFPFFPSSSTSSPPLTFLSLQPLRLQPCYFFPLWVFLGFLCLLTPFSSRSRFLILLGSAPLARASHFTCATER